MLKVVGARGDTTIVPPASIKMDLRRPRQTSGPSPTPAPIGTKVKARQSTGQSWWTARATAGEVRAGFTKEEILKPPKEDPDAPGGVFTRVRGLLGELTGVQ
jgi:hypothetical protein